MAFVNEFISYDFTPEAKVAMAMVLDQFSADLTTIHEIKELLLVPGSVVMDAHRAVVLARLIAPYYPAWSDKLLRPLQRVPAMTPNRGMARRFELMERVA